jgi:MFS transporter, PPP family, 3-phenylpropionic acid transporter
MRKFWPFTFYFLYFAAFASLLPYFVLFYQRLGFSGAQIGLLTGVPPLVTLVATPFWTGVADAKQWHKLVMSLGIAVTVVVIFLLQSLTSFILVFAAILLFNFFFSAVPSLADSATISMLGEERAMYGRIRLGGTIGWGLFAPIAGVLVQNYGLKIGFWGFCLIMLMNFFVSQKFVHGSREKGVSNPGGIRVFLTSRRWIHFLFVAFLGGVGAFSGVSYLFPYMAELGANETMMGIAITISTLTELPVFFLGHRLVKKFGSYGLLILALVMLGIRSLLYAAVDSAFLVLIVQIFGGTIFPAMWLAGVSYADQNAPPGLKSTAQGLFGAVTFGVGAAVSGFIAGPLLENIGGRGMFLVFGVIIFAGLGIIEGIKRVFPEKTELPQTAAISSDK